ncbi:MULTISPECIES: DUF3226 domain-containing protein [unclassified Mesotoga]|uniref:DUF3226 domain-containing protein n=1 Tax=unclassified Mesotoga TaxID=1184398 RepID=UPI000DA6832C|nr:MULTISPECIES: DUF3226 domain-containing protein [unclassified Mesotoga]PZC51947.1 hypothetical protein LH53_08025 [Mesotoga sp. TolDC]
MKEKDNENKFLRPRLILVEGAEEYFLLIELFKRLGYEDIEVGNYEGNNNLGNFMNSMVKLTNYKKNVKVIGILRDCENNRQAGFQSIQSALEKVGLPVPNEEDSFAPNTNVAVIVRLIPISVDEGCLEDIFIQSLSEDEALKPANDYVDKLIEMKLKLRHKKALVHAYLASKPEPYKLIGTAAKCNYWDFEHIAFKQLIDFIEAVEKQPI